MIAEDSEANQQPTPLPFSALATQSNEAHFESGERHRALRHGLSSLALVNSVTYLLVAGHGPPSSLAMLTPHDTPSASALTAGAGPRSNQTLYRQKLLRCAQPHSPQICVKSFTGERADAPVRQRTKTSLSGGEFADTPPDPLTRDVRECLEVRQSRRGNYSC